MPLIKSSSKQAVSDNIRTEMNEGGKKQSQAVAIALSIARRAKRASGGSTPGKSTDWPGAPENPKNEDFDERDPRYFKSQRQAMHRQGSTGPGTTTDEGTGTVHEGASPGQGPVNDYSPSSRVYTKIGDYDKGLINEGNTPRKSGGSVERVLSAVRRARMADGGAATPPFERTEAREMVKEGPIISGVPGRTDRLPITVPANSYVMPADLLSGLPGAQGNTMAGHRILEKMFGMGPYGSSMPKEGGHWRAPPRTEFRQSRGGKVGGHEQLIPIIVAGGEFVVPPRIVAMIGGGDHKKGHEILDKFVLEVRKSHIKTLKGLPPPVKK